MVKTTLYLAAAATFAAVMTTPASAMPNTGTAIRDAAEATDIVDNVALYVVEGRRYCFYFSGWHGPGWYRCGFAFRRGLGWGGAYGWRGWDYGPAARRFGGGVTVREGRSIRGGDRIREGRDFREGGRVRSGATVREGTTTREGMTTREGSSIRGRSGVSEGAREGRSGMTEGGRSGASVRGGATTGTGGEVRGGASGGGDMRGGASGGANVRGGASGGGESGGGGRGDKQ